MVTNKDAINALNTLKSYCYNHKCEDCVLNDCYNKFSCSETMYELCVRVLDDRKTKKVKSNVKKVKSKSKKVKQEVSMGSRGPLNLKIKTEKSGVYMDYIDVRDELIHIKDYFEALVRTTDDKTLKYKASYSAVAVAEAANLVTKYLKHPEEFVKESTEDLDLEPDEGFEDEE